MDEHLPLLMMESKLSSTEATSPKYTCVLLEPVYSKLNMNSLASEGGPINFTHAYKTPSFVTADLIKILPYATIFDGDNVKLVKFDFEQLPFVV
eukprot:14251.XXX_726845_727126_1 [CDS] Oithona nana genome sequencing.